MKRELIFSLLGYVCLLIVGWALGLWIYIADGSQPYEVEQQLYFSYFPEALRGRILSAIDIVIAALGIFFITTANNRIISKIWKGVNVAVIVLLGLILFMNVWSLM